MVTRNAEVYVSITGRLQSVRECTWVSQGEEYVSQGYKEGKCGGQEFEKAVKLYKSHLKLNAIKLKYFSTTVL